MLKKGWLYLVVLIVLTSFVYADFSLQPDTRLLRQDSPITEFANVGLTVGTYEQAGTNYLAYSIAKFSFDNVYFDVNEIEKAELVINVKSGSINPLEVQVNRITQDWDRATFQNIPTYVSPTDTLYLDEPANYLIDITDLVQDWMTTGNNNGILIKEKNENINRISNKDIEVSLKITFTGCSGCPDVNGDNTVGIADLVKIATKLFSGDTYYDLNADNKVRLGDVFCVVRNYGVDISDNAACTIRAAPGSGEPEPEPGEEEELKIPPIGPNIKNEDMYEDKQVFLVSDKDWKEVLPWVSSAVWTSDIEIKPKTIGWLPLFETSDSIVGTEILFTPEKAFDLDSVTVYYRQKNEKDYTYDYTGEKDKIKVTVWASSNGRDWDIFKTEGDLILSLNQVTQKEETVSLDPVQLEAGEQYLIKFRRNIPPPPRPSGVPEDATYNPNKKQWEKGDSTWDKDGNLIIDLSRYPECEETSSSSTTTTTSVPDEGGESGSGSEDSCDETCAASCIEASMDGGSCNDQEGKFCHGSTGEGSGKVDTYKEKEKKDVSSYLEENSCVCYNMEECDPETPKCDQVTNTNIGCKVKCEDIPGVEFYGSECHIEKFKPNEDCRLPFTDEDAAESNLDKWGRIFYVEDKNVKLNAPEGYCKERFQNCYVSTESKCPEDRSKCNLEITKKLDEIDGVECVLTTRIAKCVPPDPNPELGYICVKEEGGDDCSTWDDEDLNDPGTGKLIYYITDNDNDPNIEYNNPKLDEREPPDDKGWCNLLTFDDEQVYPEPVENCAYPFLIYHEEDFNYQTHIIDDIYIENLEELDWMFEISQTSFVIPDIIINDNLLIWIEHDIERELNRKIILNSKLILYNLDTKETETLHESNKEKSFLTFYNNLIIWVEEKQVHIYNLDSKTTSTIPDHDKVITIRLDNEKLYIFSDPFPEDIVISILDLQTNTLTNLDYNPIPIKFSSPIGFNLNNPQVSGDYILFRDYGQDKRELRNKFLYNIKTNEVISLFFLLRQDLGNIWGDNYYLYNEKIYFIGEEYNSYSLYSYDLNSEELIFILGAPTDSDIYSIFGDEIIISTEDEIDVISLNSGEAVSLIQDENIYKLHSEELKETRPKVSLFSNRDLIAWADVRDSKIYVYSKKIQDYRQTGIDYDSIIDFLKHYESERVVFLNSEIDQIVDDLKDTATGLSLTDEKIESYTLLDNYTDNWESFYNVLYVEDSYNLALVASAYSTLINAPLIIQGSELDIDELLKNRNIICVGKNTFSDRCNEEYETIKDLQDKYMDLVDTNRIIFTNPADIVEQDVIYPDDHLPEYIVTENNQNKIYHHYTKTSLTAPILSSDHRLLIPTSDIPTFDKAKEIYSENVGCGISNQCTEQSCINKIDSDIIQNIIDANSQLKSNLYNYFPDIRGASQYKWQTECKNGDPCFSITDHSFQREFEIFENEIVYNFFYKGPERKGFALFFSGFLSECPNKKEDVEIFINGKKVGKHKALCQDPPIIEKGETFLWGFPSDIDNKVEKLEKGKLTLKFNGKFFIPIDRQIPFYWISNKRIKNPYYYRCEKGCIDLASKRVRSTIDVESKKINFKFDNLDPSEKYAFYIEGLSDLNDLSIIEVNGQDFTKILTEYLTYTNEQKVFFNIPEDLNTGSIDISLRVRSKDFNPNDYSASIRKRLNQDYFLTILGSPIAIPYKELGGVTPGIFPYSLYNTIDNSLYGAINNDKLIDLAVGRISGGLTITDTSSLLARNKFYSSFPPPSNIGLMSSLVNNEHNQISESLEMASKFEQAGYSTSVYLHENEDVFEGDPSMWEGMDMISYNDHGSPEWAGIYSYELPKIFNAQVFNNACSTCATVNSNSFCNMAIRQGSSFHVGSSGIAYGANPVYTAMINRIYLENNPIGVAFRDSHMTFNYFDHRMSMLVGDPTFQVNPPYPLPSPITEHEIFLFNFK